jgi:cyanophycinase-like exopeptidase
VLEGVQVILRYFLKIKTIEELEEGGGDGSHSRVGQLISTMTSYLTFGIVGNVSDTQVHYGADVGTTSAGTKILFDSFQETCDCLMYDIKQVVEIFVNGWYLSKDFLEVA